MTRSPLPVDVVLPELIAGLRSVGAVVLRAPTGAGKTTRVPPAVLDAGLAARGRVVMLEPRRVAARAAARRMAEEHGSAVGERFGYSVRFDQRYGPSTRGLVVTPGVLLRMLHDDPYLETVACVVFDEFHERGLESDLALGLVRLVRQTVRPDLLVVVMSATFETAAAAKYLGDCPVVASDGRSFPVDVRYRPRRSDTPLPEAMADTIRDVVPSVPGDLLGFLPGVREIRQTADRLATWANANGLAVLPLHGELAADEQDRALRKGDRRKIVLATNVAETSVTVEGVTIVIDGGQARQQQFDAAVGMDRLVLGPISQAAADQRAGRAGRTAPGVCVRLWDEAGHRARAEHTEPEIRRVDLAPAVLQLLAMGESDLTGFPWFDPPRPETVTAAVRLLELLGAVQHGTLTPLGKTMAGLPCHPRLGRMLLEAAALGVPGRAATAAAILSDRDPFDRTDDPLPTDSDVLDRVEAVEQFESQRSQLGRLVPGAAWNLLEAKKQLARLVPTTAPPAADPDAALLRAVFAAYPDRLARRRARGERRAVTVDGRGVRLAPSSGVVEPELFVCVDVDAGGVESWVRQASGVRREWLPADQVTVGQEIEFDDATERLSAWKRTRFNGLIIDQTQGHFGDDEAAAAVLAAAAVRRLADVLPPPESAAGLFRLRVRCLRQWVPELDLPAFEPADLHDVVLSLCRGRRSFADVRNGPWLDAFRGVFTYAQLQTIEREAPAAVTVPGGRVVPLVYEDGRPPVLAARIQELFGLLETPRVGQGRVKVLVHLLAPNDRPQQVTDDLASFWASTYAVVRKDLRGRYPKHDWPDDPYTATASRGPKRRV